MSTYLFRLESFLKRAFPVLGSILARSVPLSPFRMVLLDLSVFYRTLTGCGGKRERSSTEEKRRNTKEKYKKKKKKNERMKATKFWLTNGTDIEMTATALPATRRWCAPAPLRLALTERQKKREIENYRWRDNGPNEENAATATTTASTQSVLKKAPAVHFVPTRPPEKKMSADTDKEKREAKKK